MNRIITKTLGWTMLAALLLSVALVASLAALIGPLDTAPVIEISGDTISLAQMSVGQGLVGVGGALLALLVVLLVVPVAVLLPLLIVSFVLIGVLLIVAGAAALVLSPLILLVGGVCLIARLARGRSRSNRGNAGATITG